VRRAVDSGDLPSDALLKAYVPLFRFTPKDIEEAVSRVEGMRLRGVKVGTINMGEGCTNDMLFKLFWSIHERSLRDSIFQGEEWVGEREDKERERMMKKLEGHARDVVRETFEEREGAKCPYMTFAVTKDVDA
jgi:hypothetical protein